MFSKNVFDKGMFEMCQKWLQRDDITETKLEAMKQLMLDACPNAKSDQAGTEGKLFGWSSSIQPLNHNHSCSDHAVQDDNYLTWCLTAMC